MACDKLTSPPSAILAWPDHLLLLGVLVVASIAMFGSIFGSGKVDRQKIAPFAAIGFALIYGGYYISWGIAAPWSNAINAWQSESLQYLSQHNCASSSFLSVGHIYSSQILTSQELLLFGYGLTVMGFLGTLTSYTFYLLRRRRR